MRTTSILGVLLLVAGACTSNNPGATTAQANPAGGGSSGASEVDAPGQVADPADLGTAAVRGFAFSTGIVDDPANAPAGAVPRAGEDLEVRNLWEQLLATVVTGADGGFDVTGLEPGVMLFVDLSGPDLRVPVTAYPGADVTLGRDFPVSRDDAAAAVLANVPAEALVAGTLQPLPAGTLVSPRGVDPATSPEASVLATAAWFFYVDLEPWLRQSHDAAYYFVDADTGAVESVDVEERPRINRGRIWSDDFELFRYLLDGQGNQIAEPTEETVQVPVVPAFLTAPAPLSVLAQSNGNDRTFFLILQTDNSTDQRADALNMSLFARAQGVPQENIIVVRFPAGSVAKRGDTEYDFQLATLKNQIEELIDPATLVVYMTTHGPRDEQAGKGTGEATIQYADREHFWKPERFEWTDLGAARVRVILDMCYARMFGLGVLAEFNELPENERPDLQIFCSSLETERSVTFPLFMNTFSFGLLTPGSRRPGFGLVGHTPNVIVQAAPE
jgi:hypothetical protein